MANKLKTSIELPPEAPQSLVEPLKEQVTQQITEQIQSQPTILQPIVQPIIKEEQKLSEKIMWGATSGTVLQEIITPSEQFAVDKIAHPLKSKGVTVYLYNIPANLVFRPNEYVIIIPDDRIGGIDFADNRKQRDECRTQVIIQGHGDTMQNYVLEISLMIYKILEDELAQGRIHRLSENEDNGYDVNVDIYTRTVSYWYRGGFD